MRLVLADVPDWLPVDDILRDRALAAAAQALQAAGVTPSAADAAVEAEMDGREFDAAALAAWNAAEQAACRALGDEDRVSRLTLIID